MSGALTLAGFKLSLEEWDSLDEESRDELRRAVDMEEHRASPESEGQYYASFEVYVDSVPIALSA